VVGLHDGDSVGETTGPTTCSPACAYAAMWPLSACRRRCRRRRCWPPGRLVNTNSGGSIASLEQTAGSACSGSCCCITLRLRTPCAGRKSLIDAAGLRATCWSGGEQTGAWHGHAHFSAATYSTQREAGLGDRGAIASAIGADGDRRAAITSYRIQDSDDGWRLRISVRAYSPERGVFVADGGQWLRSALAAAPA